MPRPKPTAEDLKEREERAVEIAAFMKKNKFTEVKLAETLGISRRTVQKIKACVVTPHPGTLKLLEALFLKYKQAR